MTRRRVCCRMDRKELLLCTRTKEEYTKTRKKYH
jgi:hypothetical protein